VCRVKANCGRGPPRRLVAAADEVTIRDVEDRRETLLVRTMSLNVRPWKLGCMISSGFCQVGRRVGPPQTLAQWHHLIYRSNMLVTLMNSQFAHPISGEGCR
jgi:hypothetical protein